MRDRVKHRLIALNVVLLALLAVVAITPEPSAADPNQPARGRGRYTVVTGTAQGITTEVIYVMDASNEELIALEWDRTRASLDAIGFRDLRDDAAKKQAPR